MIKSNLITSSMTPCEHESRNVRKTRSEYATMHGMTGNIRPKCFDLETRGVLFKAAETGSIKNAFRKLY